MAQAPVQKTRNRSRKPAASVEQPIADDQVDLNEQETPEVQVQPDPPAPTLATLSVLEQVCQKYQMDPAKAPMALVNLCNDLNRYCSTMSTRANTTPESIASGYQLLQQIYSSATSQPDPHVSQICIDAVSVYFSTREHDVFSARLIGRFPSNQPRNSHLVTMVSALTRFFTVSAKVSTRREIAKYVDMATLARYLPTDVQRNNVTSYVNN